MLWKRESVPPICDINWRWSWLTLALRKVLARHIIETDRALLHDDSLRMEADTGKCIYCLSKWGCHHKGKLKNKMPWTEKWSFTIKATISIHWKSFCLLLSFSFLFSFSLSDMLKNCMGLLFTNPEDLFHLSTAHSREDYSCHCISWEPISPSQTRMCRASISDAAEHNWDACHAGNFDAIFWHLM